MYNDYFLGTKISSIAQNATGDTLPDSLVVYGRVVAIVLNETNVIFDKNGNKLPIGGIKYELVTQGEESTENQDTAIPLFTGIQSYPVVNELVTIINGPSIDSQINTEYQTKYYLSLGAVNAWGAVNHNAVPAQGVDFDNPIGQDVKELKNINPIYPFPGDTVMQGRQGQSIRIGGYKTKYNTLTDNSNDGKPFTIISNGQIDTADGVAHILEDINKDANSLYFLSDHKVPLIAANTKRAAYNTPPVQSDQYKGNQVLVNGGRLYFNAKEESILLSAKESIGLNAKTVNIDAQEYMCMDADKIYIGERARTATPSTAQPAVLGKELQDWMTQLLINLKLVGLAMQNASAVGAGPVTSLNMIGPALQTSIDGLINRMKQFQSNKIYIE